MRFCLIVEQLEEKMHTITQLLYSLANACEGSKHGARFALQVYTIPYSHRPTFTVTAP